MAFSHCKSLIKIVVVLLLRSVHETFFLFPTFELYAREEKMNEFSLCSLTR